MFATVQSGALLKHTTMSLNIKHEICHVLVFCQYSRNNQKIQKLKPAFQCTQKPRIICEPSLPHKGMYMPLSPPPLSGIWQGSLMVPRKLMILPATSSSLFAQITYACEPFMVFWSEMWQGAIPDGDWKCLSVRGEDQWLLCRRYTLVLRVHLIPPATLSGEWDSHQGLHSLFLMGYHTLKLDGWGRGVWGC